MSFFPAPSHITEVVYHLIIADQVVTSARCSSCSYPSSSVPQFGNQMANSRAVEIIMVLFPIFASKVLIFFK